ncbi:MAG: hypothetical protein GY816_16725, partial [Cytophagales bacterium]|nr:hypothetical protein [Cytophagales bacterium]
MKFTPLTILICLASISIQAKEVAFITSDNSRPLHTKEVVATPTVQATDITYSNIGSTQVDITWTNGNGANRVVVASEGSAVDTNPTNGISYAANAQFSSGDELGSGNYVVFNGTGTSFTLTGLTLNTVYHLRIYEYDGTGGAEQYNNTANGNPKSVATILLSSTVPSRNAEQVAADANIVFTFLENMSQSSIDGGTASVLDDNIIVRGANTGLIAGNWSGDGTTTITFNPEANFKAGEVIYVTLTTGVQTNGGTPLAKAVPFEFRTASNPGPETPDYFNEHDGGTITSSADGAYSVFAVDMDGDGDMDVLSASYNDDKIVWYENDGAQSFTAHTITTSANGAYSVFAVDMDGDGDMDVLSASEYDDKIAWYENDGSQNFTPYTITTSANGARSVYAVDMDGDGDMDVLSASYNDDKIAWYTNEGAGTFTPHTITTSANGAFSVYATDVDGDGDMDVLSASHIDDKIAWYENDGTQSFTTNTISTSADGARSVYATDMDGDGDMDILSGSYNDDKIAWYDNDGAQSFTANNISLLANGVNSVYAVDMDGDGDMDVLSASVDAKIAWYENDGSQSFTAQTITTSAFGAHSVYALDMDSDGDMDVLSASYSDDKIALYSNTVAPPSTQTTNVSSSNIGINMTDISWTSGDGSRRLVVAKKGGVVDANPIDGITYSANSIFGNGTELGNNNYVVYDGVGAGFTLTGLTGNTIYNLMVYEYNGTDGDENYKSESSSGNPVSVTTLPLLSSTSPDKNDVSIALDANISFTFSENMDEGSVDRGTATVLDDNIKIRGEYTGIIDGVWTGDGTTTITFNPTLDFKAGEIIRITMNDDVESTGGILSGDYNFEFRTVTANGPETPLNFNSYDSEITTSANGASSVSAVDMDGDGDMDVLSASRTDDKIAWYENDGAQSFTTHTISLSADGANSVYAVDMDGDGDMDVLSASGTDDKIAWYENDGSQSFTAYTISLSADYAKSVYAADMDGDGDMDVLSASYYDDKIAWYENDGAQSFTTHTISLTADGANSVYAVDMDGDGDMDVLSASGTD